MFQSIIRITACLAGGAACGFFTRYWIEKLQTERKLEYRLTAKHERILLVAMILLGGAIGALTSGLGEAVSAMILLCVCGAVSVIDWEYRVIPNEAVLVLFGAKLVLWIGCLFDGTKITGHDVLQSFLGMTICFLIFLLPGLLGKKVGAGDVKLAAAMGFLLGTYDSLLSIVIMGLLVFGYGFLRRRGAFLAYLQSTIPMGPFITIGMFAAFIGSPFLRMSAG